jgi:hypothetical protein
MPCAALHLTLLAVSLAAPPPPAIRLESPVEWQVFQRDSMSRGRVALRGLVDGPASRLEARWTGRPREGVLPDGWGPLRLTADGGFREEVDLPAGGWYVLELRAEGPGGPSGIRIDRVGVGEVFVGAGQSNSTNHGEEKLRPSTGLVSAFDGRTWRAADDPQPGVQDGSGGGSFWPAFGDAMAARFWVPIGVAPAGCGATSVRQWLPEGERFRIPPTTGAFARPAAGGGWECDGRLFEGLAARIAALGPPAPRAVLWHQGESDGNQPEGHTLPGAEYRSLLEKVILASRKRAGRDVPWFVARATYHTPDDPSSPDIRDAQKALWDSGIALEGPDTDSLTGDNRDGGGRGVHLSGKGLRAHGALWAAKVGDWLDRELSGGAGGRRVEVEAVRETVGRFEKAEFRIRFEGSYANPFDPTEVDVALEVRTPGGSVLEVPGFFFQDHEWRRVPRGGREHDWLYPAGEPSWLARLAPMEVGEHVASARVKDARGEFRSPEVRFSCVSSKRPGFVRVSEKDPRFFERSDGTPFFPIGQNLAFIGPGQHVDLGKAREIFEALSRNGANFLRLWACCEDWAMAIEARKSAWGRSWGPKPPVEPLPDDPASGRTCVRLEGEDGKAFEISPSHPVALRPSTRYAISGCARTDGRAGLRLELESGVREELVKVGAPPAWTGFRKEFETRPDGWWLGPARFRLAGAGAAWIAGVSLREAAGGPNLLWEADVDRPVPGSLNPTDCAMLDRIVELAEAKGICLQLCVITRDLYMGSLKDPSSPAYRKAVEDAKKLFRHAAARWGYSTSVATWEYFNEIDPGLPTGAFYAEVGEHLRRVDVHRHLRATSAWAPSPRDWALPSLDQADMHFYIRPGDRKRFRNEVEALLDRARFLRERAPSRPALLAEFGLATEDWRLSPDMRLDTKLVHFHDALWASTLSGLSGTALFWWWEDLDRMDAYGHYGPVARFVEGIPFTTGKLAATSGKVSGADLRLVGLQGPDRAYLWVLDPRAAWIGGAVAAGGSPGKVRGASVELRGLDAGTYRVRWWDTWAGKVAAEESRGADAGGALRLPVPAFERDIAAKIERR